MGGPRNTESIANDNDRRDQGNKIRQAPRQYTLLPMHLGAGPLRVRIKRAANVQPGDCSVRDDAPQCG